MLLFVLLWTLRVMLLTLLFVLLLTLLWWGRFYCLSCLTASLFVPLC